MICPACGGSTHAFLEATADQRKRYLEYSRLKYGGLLDDWLIDLQLVLCHCADCGHWWYRDVPSVERLDAMYAAGIPLFSHEAPSRVPTPEMRTAMRGLRRIVSHESQPSLLDFGSGFGRWARAAVQVGFEVHAYEPSKTRGREESPPFTLVHTIAELGLRKFDVINLEQVLEHIPSPVATLQSLHSLCKPGAVLRIAVPNILRSVEGAELWRDWPFNGMRPHTLAPFEHLHGFTPESLKRLVNRAGFSEIKWSRLISTHPQLALRRVVGQLWLPFDQTLVIAQSPLGH